MLYANCRYIIFLNALLFCFKANCSPFIDSLPNNFLSKLRYIAFKSSEGVVYGAAHGSFFGISVQKSAEWCGFLGAQEFDFDADENAMVDDDTGSFYHTLSAIYGLIGGAALGGIYGFYKGVDLCFKESLEAADGSSTYLEKIIIGHP